jgi:integrase
VRLTDDLDWPKQITQLNRQRDAELGKTVVVDGTVAWTIQKYRETDAFEALSEGSTKVYQRWLAELEKLFGMLPVSAMTRKVCVDYIETYKAKPPTQKQAQAVLYNVLEAAKYHGLIAGENPAGKMRLASPNRRDQIWTKVDCAAWLAIAREHPLASVLVPYFKLLEWTAQRPGDVLAMQWSQYDGDWIGLTQQKTGKKVQIPVFSELRAVLDDLNAAVVHIGGHIVARPDGRQYSKSRMVHLFHEVSVAAGLEHLQARDLRRTACVRLAEADCNDILVASISGHSIEATRRILETYVPRTAAMARAAMDKMETKWAQKSDASDSNEV